MYCSVKLALSEKIIKGKSKYQALDHRDTRGWLWAEAGSERAFPSRRSCVGRSAQVDNEAAGAESHKCHQHNTN